MQGVQPSEMGGEHSVELKKCMGGRVHLHMGGKFPSWRGEHWDVGAALQGLHGTQPPGVQLRG